VRKRKHPKSRANLFKRDYYENCYFHEDLPHGITKFKKQQKRRQDKRLYPFDDSTRLIELVDKRHYGDVVKLVKRLNPYLTDENNGVFMRNRLFFDLNKLAYKRQFVYDELAQFLKKVKAKNGLLVKQNVFFRYLSCPNHCNLGISENSWKALILEAIRRNP
jgi:hypothetical protein